MGSKSQHRNLESDRPESGGADRDDRFEKSGVLEREKEEFAARDAEKKRSKPESIEQRDESVEPGDDVGSGRRESPKSGGSKN